MEIAATTAANTAEFTVLAISALPLLDNDICSTAFRPPYSAAALTIKTRTRRRPSTRSDGQDAMVCATARTIKPSASRLTAIMDSRTPDAGASHMQLTKLKAATAAQISACHQRSLNVSSNSARVNSQNTTALPVDSAITGACSAATCDVAPIDAVTACAADPSA